jgi:putative PIN family toxin of toxin-antitoxin system
MIRVVIDTNVLVSAMFSLSGNEALLLLAVKQGFMKPCFSPAVLEEYSEVLARRKFGFSRTKLRRLPTCFTVRAIWCTLTRYPECLPTPRMTKFMACALAAQADFMVTGNKQDFPQDRLGDTQVVSAGELLNLITLEF